MPGHKVSADEWNALFNLSRVQGNNNAEGIALLMEMVGDSVELPSILDDYDRRINSAEELVNDLAKQVASFDTKLSEEYIIGLVSKTYVTKAELETTNHNIETFTEKVNEVERKVSDEAIINTVSSEFYKKTEVDAKVLEQRESFNSELKQEADSIKASVKGLTDRMEEAELALTEGSLVAKLSSTYATKSTVEGIDQRVTTLTEDLSNVKLELTTERILAKVSDVVATKQEVNALQDQYDTLNKSVTEYKAEIDVQKESIASVVDKTEQIEQDLIEKSAEIIETSEQITLEILQGYTSTSQLEEYKTKIENLLSVNQEGVDILFRQMEQRLTELGDEIVEQEQYIRLVNGEIHIGKSDSLVTSVYTNHSLEFRYNGQMVARFTNEVLEVRNISSENQVAFFNQWAIRKGAHIEGVGYNLNDIWIGG